MQDRYYSDEDNEELLSYVPEFDSTTLSASTQKRIRRYEESEMAQAEMDASRIVNRNKVAMVAALSQGRLEEVITLLLQRNPRRHAAANLFYIAEGNAEALRNILFPDRDDYWG